MADRFTSHINNKIGKPTPEKQPPAKRDFPFDTLVRDSIASGAPEIAEADFSARAASVFARNGIPDALITPEKIADYYRFLAALLGVNRVMNLTAIRDADEAILKHFADSLTVAPYLPQGAFVVDLGCGGGFPSVPLAIARPDLKILAMDSTAKKIDFVSAVAAALGLSGLSTVTARAEEWVNSKGIDGTPNRESVDAVVSRAVARLNVLDELALPMLKRGGLLIAMKGARGDEELREAEKGITALGGEVVRTERFSLTDPDKIDMQNTDGDGESGEQRVLILIKKSGATPSVYPRTFGQITKKPL